MNESFYTYHFTESELSALALFLRREEQALPNEVKNFYSFLESNVYDNLTIDEAEEFFL